MVCMFYFFSILHQSFPCFANHLILDTLMTIYAGYIYLIEKKREMNALVAKINSLLNNSL